MTKGITQSHYMLIICYPGLKIEPLMPNHAEVRRRAILRVANMLKCGCFLWIAVGIAAAIAVPAAVQRKCLPRNLSNHDQSNDVALNPVLQHEEWVLTVHFLIYYLTTTAVYHTSYEIMSVALNPILHHAAVSFELQLELPLRLPFQLRFRESVCPATCLTMIKATKLHWTQYYNMRNES